MSNGDCMASTDPVIRLVICDAGPLIHLDELGCLDLLSSFAIVLIPDTVWEEVLHHRPQAIDTCQTWAKRVTPTRVLPPDLEATTRLFSLHAGEIQAINIAQECQADLLLTDDTAARLAAASAGIQVRGTLGILLRAIQHQQKTADEVLAILRSIPSQSTLHIRASLLQEVIGQVETFQ